MDASNKRHDPGLHRLFTILRNLDPMCCFLNVSWQDRLVIITVATHVFDEGHCCISRTVAKNVGQESTIATVVTFTTVTDPVFQEQVSGLLHCFHKGRMNLSRYNCRLVVSNALYGCTLRMHTKKQRRHSKDLQLLVLSLGRAHADHEWLGSHQCFLATLFRDYPS